MTAIATRRRRNTWVALGLSCIVLLAAGGLAYAGVDTLRDSKAGRRVGTDSLAQTQTLPYTPTALIATADETGRVTSAAVMVIEPDGTGGSIVAVSASADMAAGAAEELRPVGPAYTVDGADSFKFGIESLTGLSFDVVEIVDAARLTELLTPLGELPIALPTDLLDASTGQSWEAGPDRLPPLEAAQVITAVDPQVEDWYLDADRAAVWSAIANRVGAGIGSADRVDGSAVLDPPATTDEFLDRLFAGPVQFRALSFTPVDSDRVLIQIRPDYREAYGIGTVDSVVFLDRAEMAMVFGAVAPSRVGAPRDASIFRVRSGFSDSDLAALGLNNADVTRRAIDRMLFVQYNIVSYTLIAPADVPDVTLIEIADPDLTSTIPDVYEDVFGEVEVRQADVLIEGIDAQVTLGRSFLAILGRDLQSPVDDDESVEEVDDPNE